ncbi:MAG: acyl-CoA thioesterase II [archaeon]|nr:acyl-CoA thioesterase II [archaeon]
MTLEEVGVDLFRGFIPPSKYQLPRTFGGQTVSQSLMAASRTVPDTVRIHSLHSYFLRPGDVTIPIMYQVQRLRDGTSFCTRTVVAKQNGKAIATLACSFQEPEQGLEHAAEMPQVPSPESLPTREQDMARLAEDPRMPAALQKLIRRHMETPMPVDIRPVLRRDPISPKPVPPQHRVWMRARHPLGDDPRMHACAAAYLSDHNLLETSMLPHAVPIYGGLQMASLDHSMWFHAPFRADQWLLYDMHSPRSIGSRGLSFGNIYSPDGVLVISTAQEGLIRLLKQPTLLPEVSKDAAAEEEEEEELMRIHRARSKQIIFGDEAEPLPAKL